MFLKSDEYAVYNKMEFKCSIDEVTEQVILYSLENCFKEGKKIRNDLYIKIVSYKDITELYKSEILCMYKNTMYQILEYEPKKELFRLKDLKNRKKEYRYNTNIGLWVPYEDLKSILEKRTEVESKLPQINKTNININSKKELLGLESYI